MYLKIQASYNDFRELDYFSAVLLYFVHQTEMNIHNDEYATNFLNLFPSNPNDLHDVKISHDKMTDTF